MSIPGGIGILVCWACRRVKTYHGRVYGIVGKSWGGLEMGCFFFCCEQSANSDYLRNHECGHGLQNIIFGPLMPFIVGIPSAVRYWYRHLKYGRHGQQAPTEYDAIWFEDMATRWGTKYIATNQW